MIDTHTSKKAEKNEIGHIIFKPNGEYRVQHDFGKNRNLYEITEEEFDRIVAIDGWRGKLNSLYEETMPDDIRFGYGFYGCDLIALNNKYYYSVCIGSSCD